jgi:hypothetical protein
MTSDNQLLVLAAGRGIGLDGFHKLNLVSPSDGRTILARYQQQLSTDVTIVVGYRAPEIMSQHPDLAYVYNYRWFETGSSYSAGLGLSRAPVIVTPSDLFLDERAAEIVRMSSGNVLFTSRTENRPQAAVNVSSDAGRILDVYQGPKRRGQDTEFRGIVRVEDSDLLSSLADACLSKASNAFFEAIVPFIDQFREVDLEGDVREINSVDDYMEFFNADRRPR